MREHAVCRQFSCRGAKIVRNMIGRGEAEKTEVRPLSVSSDTLNVAS